MKQYQERLKGQNANEENALIMRINKYISEWNKEYASPGYEISFSIGCAMWEVGKDLLEVINEADSLMFKNKRK